MIKLRLLKRIKIFLIFFIFAFILLTNTGITAQELKKLSLTDILPATVEDIAESIDSLDSESLKQKEEELTNLGLFNKTSGSLGNIIYSAVKMDGRIIFQVASALAVYEDDEDGNIKINIRVRKIENTLTEIIKRNLAPNLLEIQPSILNNETVIKISRTDQTQEWILMTITRQDAQLYGVSISELAKIRSHNVRDALARAWQERQTKFLIRQFLIALGIIIAMFLASFLLIHLRKYLSPKKTGITIYVME